PGERGIQFPAGAQIRTLLEGLDLEIPEGISESQDEPPSHRGPFTVLLNGRNIEFLDGLDTRLAEGDVVAIFLASDGG
ncbi:MAG: MoaD/ThiS family protein, partial [Methanomicrobiales archaeon]|nr:MoaD/ThiS family protein [Methanomicrobiales archaeon]